MEIIATIAAVISALAAVISIPIGLKAKSISQTAITKVTELEQEINNSGINLKNSSIDKNTVVNGSLISVQQKN